MSNGMEKRRSFRILESVYLEYKVISEQVFNEGLERWKMRQGTGAGIRSNFKPIFAPAFSFTLLFWLGDKRGLITSLGIATKQ